MKIKRGFKESKLYQWQNAGAGTCEKCLRENVKLTVDHIIPISILDRLDDGYEIALNDEENFQHLCYPCNSMKSSNLDITNPKTATLMVKYMQPYLNETN